MLADDAALRYFNCVPNPLESPHSSLGYMMKRVAKERGDGKTGWYLRDGDLLFETLKTDLQASVAESQPVCLAATAFALVHVLDEMEREGLRLSVPPGSRVMETGGFKGRARMVSREELYERTCDRFGVDPEAVVAEYGMTELSSQYYDRVALRRTDSTAVQDRRHRGCGRASSAPIVRPFRVVRSARSCTSIYRTARHASRSKRKTSACSTPTASSC